MWSFITDSRPVIALLGAVFMPFVVWALEVGPIMRMPAPFITFAAFIFWGAFTPSRYRPG